MARRRSTARKRRRKERIPGGLAEGRHPSEFDAKQLEKGTRVELEHTGDLAVAEEIAMDHLMEDPRYYDKLERMHANRSKRPKLYDARDIAKNMRETFADRPVERTDRFDFTWPAAMQNVGDSLAVAYASDKWNDRDSFGNREVELYKHLAESRNRALAAPDVLYDRYSPNTQWSVRGPMVSLAELPMPKHFAILGLFEEIDLKLFTKGTNANPRFGSHEDDGVVHVQVAHGHLGGSKILWSRLDPNMKDEPFIFVYTKSGGVMFLVIGEDLDIEKDGIVG